MNLDPNDFYRTDDMAMVTFLKLEGYALQAIAWEAETCYWYFRVTDAMLETMESFENNEARVDPKLYNREFARTKREFFNAKPSVQAS